MMAGYLMDTHIFIWVTCDASQLSKKCTQILADDSRVYLSMASIWEMQIKYQLGKLPITKPLDEIIDDVIKNRLYHILPITQNHILNLKKLEFHHKDPFDRMLISQAMMENLTLLTVDEQIIQYPIKTIS